MKRALFVGRFQPYHLGHHKAVKKILEEFDELIIVVGSSQESYMEKSPFTCGERIEMISLALKEEGLFDRCFIIGVPDISEHSVWVSRVKEYAPEFDIVFTNNPLTKFLFEKEEVEVRQIKVGFPKISSTVIRNRLASQSKWKTFLHETTGKFLKKIKADKRMKAISEKEKK